MIGQENLDPQRNPSSLKRKQASGENQELLNLKKYKRSQDDQHHKLSVQSPYVKGEFCAQIRGSVACVEGGSNGSVACVEGGSN